MPRVSAAFFVVGALFVLGGMLLGMYMGGSEDFRLVPVHAHLNLLGWVTMALYGTFYALTSKTMSARLAWTNFGLSLVSVLILLPTLAFFLLTRNTNLIPVMIAGELLSVAGLAVFLVSALRELTRRRAEAQADAPQIRMAAE